MLSWLIENTLVAGVLAAVLLASSRWLEKRPAVGNFGWLLVIVLVVMPPMPNLFSSGVRGTITAPVAWVGGLLDRPGPMRDTTHRSAERSDRPYEPTLGTDWNASATRDSHTIAADEPGRESAAGYSAPSKPARATRSIPIERSVLLPGDSYRLAGTTGSAEPSRPITQPIGVSPARVAAIDEGDSNPPLVWPADELARVEPISVNALGNESSRLAQADSPVKDPSVSGEDRSLAAEPAAVVPAPKRAAKRFNTRRALATLGIAFAAAWGLGLAWIAWRQALRVRSMRSIEKDSQQNEQLTARVGAIAERFGVRPPRTIVSDRVEGPMVWNLGRSVLVWPASIPVGTTGTDGMIAHELAHLRRGDHWAAWLELAAITLFWWHPLVWVAHRRAREFAELACDAWVSWVLPSDRRAYAEALVSAASKRAELESRGGRGGPALAFGVVESSRDDFKRRLTMVMTGRGSRRLPPAVAAAGLGLVMMLAPSVAGEFTTAPPDTVQIEGLDLIDDVFHPALKRMTLIEQAERFERAEEYGKAAKAYRDAIKLGADAQDDLAMLYYDSEQWGDGTEAFVAAYEADGDSDDLYNAACCAALNGDKGDAVKLLKRAVAAGYSDGDHLMSDSDLESVHDRDDVKEIARLASAIEELEDLADEAEDEGAWAEAARAYGKLAELVPDEKSYLHDAAYSSIYAGELDNAREWLEKQIEAGEGVSTAMYNMACVESLDGNESRAMTWLERAVDNGFTQHQTMREDPDLDAIRDRDGFDELVRRASRTQRLQREMQLEADFGEWDAAAAKAERLLELSDSNDWTARQARQMLAQTYEHRGEYADAIDVLLQSAKSGKDVHPTMMAIAIDYAKDGQTRKGAAYLAALIEVGHHDASFGDFNSDFDFDGDFDFSFGDGINVNAGGVWVNGNAIVSTGSREVDSAVMKGLYEHPLVKAALQRQRDREEMAQFGVESWGQLESQAREDLAENDEDGGAYIRLGWSLLRQMKLDDAIDAFESLGEHGSKQLSAYNIACCHAVGGDTDEAFEYLHKAAEAGYADLEQYASDPDLESLHGDSRWESLMGDLKDSHKADAREHDHDGWEDADEDWNDEDGDDEDDGDWDAADDLDEI